MRGLVAVLALLAQAQVVPHALARNRVPSALWRDLAEAAPQASREGGNAVFVDVIATDSRGRIVENLKPGDFELRQDGSMQSIDEVRFVKTDSTRVETNRTLPIQSEPDGRAEARPARRLFAIFLDEYHVDAANAERVRGALLRFVDESLGSSDLLVVMRPLDSLLTIRMTRDRDEARRAIEEFSGRKGDYTPRSASEENYFAGTPARVEQLRAQVTTSALNAIAVHLGSLDRESRKTLVLVSEALPRVDRRRGFESLPTVDSVIRSANRSNVAIYVVDPRPGPPDASAPDAGDVLRTLTNATGGQDIAHADLQVGMRPISAEASGYYLLVYRPAQTGDGAFHDLQVGVKRPGVTVRARKGYWAPPPSAELRANLSDVRPSLAPDLPRRISSLIKPWFGAARGTEGKTRVTFVWEPATRAPGGRTRQASASRIVLTALGADGTPLFEGPVLPSGPLRPEAARAAEARAVFEAPPGMLRLRMSIEDHAAQTIDSDVRELRVRDLNGPVVLGTAAFLRARTARDFRALESDPDAVPVASREFSRAERLMIRFPAYAPNGAALSISARLLNRGGQVMRDLPVRTSTAAGAPNEIDLPLASLAASDYYVEVTAKSSAGDVKDLLEFRVTN